MDLKYSLTKLNGNNYFNWRYKMQMYLTKKAIWSVIKDDKPEPVTAEWTKNDQDAHSMIALCIDDDQIQHVRNCTSAKEAWLKLKEFHEKDSPNNRVSILRKLMTKRLDEDGDVESHVNQMNELFQKLLALGESFKPELILSATLIGSLPESYNSLAAILESRNEELTSSLVCSMIIDEYKRRKERNVGTINESILRISSTSSKREVICYFCDKKGHFKQNCTEHKEWLEKKQKQPRPSEEANVIFGDGALNDGEEYLF